jgi:hypothetical protein
MPGADPLARVQLARVPLPSGPAPVATFAPQTGPDDAVQHRAAANRAIEQSIAARRAGKVARTEPRRAALRRTTTSDRADADKASGLRVAAVVDHALRSKGQPLDSKTRTLFEERFGHDFGGVRLHADHTAAEASRLLSARAFAVGEHVVFGGGQYQPDTAAGKHLLAHELAHVVQQSRGGTTPSSSPAVARLEASADAAAAAATRGASVKVDGATPTGVQLNAEVYIWNPHVDGYGHAAIKLCDGTYISWWPAGGATSKAEQYWSGRPGGPHSYADDIGPGGESKGPDATYDLGCNCLDEDRIKKWYDKNFISNPTPKWAVLKNSCSDVAHQALNEGSSFTNPCYLSISHSNLFWTPKDLGAYAECQARWCKSKSGGAVDATGRYVWENVKELAGGGAINFLQSLWWKGEIIAH